MKPAIMFPDLDGRDCIAGGFGDLLAALYPSARVIAVLNGDDPQDLQKAANSSAPHVETLVSPHAGLAPSLLFAYKALAAETAPPTVVRLDTAENPPGLVEHMLKAAEVNGGCIGDPEFNEHTLRSGSADAHSQLDVFPSLFCQMTDGALSLSGTHGFQAWSGDALPSVVARAEAIWTEANEAAPLRWGFDAAMALGAIASGVDVQVLRYPAMEMRNRPSEKIAAQFDAVLRVCLAFKNQQA